MTIEDEEKPRMDRRIDSGLALAEKIARYGGLFVVLIHPNVTAEKFIYERDLTAALRNTAWFGSIDQIGPWWAARDRVQLDVEDASGGSKTVTLDAKWPTQMLAVRVPAGWQFVPSDAILARQTGRLVVIDKVRAGKTSLTFRTTLNTEPS
ncbi:MAG: hypothetical protein ABR585_01545 [Gemmatimonadaceae bacterium]